MFATDHHRCMNARSCARVDYIYMLLASRWGGKMRLTVAAPLTQEYTDPPPLLTTVSAGSLLVDMENVNMKYGPCSGQTHRSCLPITHESPLQI